MLNGKVMIIPLIVELIKKMSIYKTSQYFPKPFQCSGGNINVELNLANYPTEVDLKGYIQSSSKIRFNYFKS